MNRSDDLLFIEHVKEEIAISRAKFPRNRHMNAALVEEVGELSKALLDTGLDEGDKDPHREVYAEAVQVAVMALRLATEGDGDFLYSASQGRALNE